MYQIIIIDRFLRKEELWVGKLWYLIFVCIILTSIQKVITKVREHLLAPRMAEKIYNFIIHVHNKNVLSVIFALPLTNDSLRQ